MTSKELPVFRFYDRKSKRRRHELEQNVENRVKRFKDEKLPHEFKHSITGPSTEWKTFYRQQDAFDFTRSKIDDDLHVFAYESDTMGGDSGQRMYLVASYPIFWHYYSQLRECERHHYEVIPEGGVCKLYFDLEFAKEVNPDSNGLQMVEIFIKYVCTWLQHHYRVHCDRQDVLDLDASTEKKFSRHLVFQLQDVVFKDNVGAGHFVHHIFNKLLDRVQPCTPGGDNPVETEPSDSTEIILPLSSAGSETSDVSEEKQDAAVSAEVKSEDRNDSGFESPLKEMEGSGSSTEKSDRGVSSESCDILGQFSDEELKSLVVMSKDQKPVLFCDMGVYTKNRNFRLLKSTKLGKKNPFCVSAENVYTPRPKPDTMKGFNLFSDSLISNVKYTPRLRILTFGSESQGSRFRHQAIKQHRSHDETETLGGYTTSPYPELDDFICRTVGDGGKNGCIRHWTYFPQGELLIYDIARYRWCANIQRQHRSNNIMLCVDMKKGVYYQKCHDPDCKADNFKSEDLPLPSEVLPGHYFNISSDGLESDFDDDDIVRAAEEAEKTYQSQQEESDDDLLNATLELEKNLSEHMKS
ncbi:DNA-directed primase/polymerase protein-like [Haliotis cracherodii]|uniref:DNA-directed primase/polymerase protein-like n=1 Tax=Haliotis cracherodii TaxID=6455 RepID=UPI0039EB8682